MNNSLSILIVSSMLCASLSAQLSVVSNDATWPTDAVVDTGAPGTALVTQEGIAHTLDYEGERDVKDLRPLLQTFDLPANVAELTLTDVYIYYWGGSTTSGGTTDTIDVLIFEIDDVFQAGNVSNDDDIANNPPLNAGNGGLPIYSGSITVEPASLGPRETSKHVLHLSLADGPTLIRRSGDAGYGFMLTNPDTDGVYPFKWSAEREPYADPPTIDQGPYLLGRPYSDNEASLQESHDFSLAIAGSTTPAPTLLSISGADTGTATLEVATGHFTSHPIEGTDDLENGPWTPISTVEGDGTIKSESVSPPTSPYFYRVTD